MHVGGLWYLSYFLVNLFALLPGHLWLSDRWSCLHFLAQSAALYTVDNSLFSDTFSSRGFQGTALLRCPWSFTDSFSVFSVRSHTHNGALGLKRCILSVYLHSQVPTPTSFPKLISNFLDIYACLSNRELSVLLVSSIWHKIAQLLCGERIQGEQEML